MQVCCPAAVKPSLLGTRQLEHTKWVRHQCRLATKQPVLRARLQSVRIHFHAPDNSNKPNIQIARQQLRNLRISSNQHSANRSFRFFLIVFIE